MKYVFFAIVGLVLCRVVRAYMLYSIVDQFLRDEYQESYSTWKAMGSSAVSGTIKDEERANVAKYEHMQKFWSEFGPLTSIFLVLATIGCCGSVLCCFSRYKRHLERYEEDPHNPANGVSF